MMVNIFSTAADTRITTFNRLALQTQDDAYTLAYYLLGDERHAERATQAAFEQIYQQARLQGDRFRFEVLRGVLECSRRMLSLMPKRTGRHIPLHTARRDATFERLMALGENERFVIVLVDVLSLDYDEAAQVLGISRSQVGKLLAQARQSLLQAQAAPSEAALPVS